MGRMRDGLGHDSSCECPQHGGPTEEELTEALFGDQAELVEVGDSE